MTALIGAAPLRKLLRLKLRGVLRRTGRRLRTPAGAVFALLGTGFVVVWLTSLGVAFRVGKGTALDPDLALPVSRLGVAILFMMSVAGTVAHRGLYLPAQEIERLFAAPLSRADLVRHRLHVLLAQSLVGGLFVALVAAARLPHPGAAAIGALLAVMTIAIAGQTASVVLGAFERRLPLAVVRGLARALSIGLLATVVGLYAFMDELPSDVRGSFEGLVTHPALAIATAPFEPWARLMNAGSPAATGSWLLVCVALLVGVFELTARLPFDFREMALATSADVAARLRRMSRGGGASSQRVSAAGRLRRVPWLFGRGPGGAIAWRKTASMVRRARATIGFSLFLLTVLVIAATAIVRAGEESGLLVGAVLITVLGTFYLCSGLRYDFREELERMDVIKAWPLAPWRLFAAMLLPEATLIALLVAAALTAYGLTSGGIGTATLAVGAFVPPFVWTWLALDNAIFLLWPVRFVPGQEGALQNMGRAAVVVLVRLVVLGALGGLGVAIGVGVSMLVAGPLGGEAGTALASAYVTAWLWLAVAGYAAAHVGGRVLARFEPGAVTN